MTKWQEPFEARFYPVFYINKLTKLIYRIAFDETLLKAMIYIGLGLGHNILGLCVINICN